MWTTAYCPREDDKLHNGCVFIGRFRASLHWPWVCGQQNILFSSVPYPVLRFLLAAQPHFNHDGWKCIFIGNRSYNHNRSNVGKHQHNHTQKHTFPEWMLKQFTIIVMWWLLVTKGAKPLIIDFKSLAFEQICFCINFYIGPPFGKGLHVCETGVDCSIASYFLCHQRCAVCVSLRFIDLVFQKCFDRFFILIVAILIWYLLFSGVQPCYCFLSF